MRRILLVLGLLAAAVACTAAGATTNPTGSIDVDKTVHGDPDCEDDAPCFVVVVDCADQIDRRQVYDRTGHLIDGPSTFHKIPVDSVCTVIETVTGGATVTYDPAGADTTGVVVTPEDPDSDVDQRVHVMVTNTFCEKDEDDCQPPPTTTVPTTTSTTTTSTTSTTTTAPPPPPTSSTPPPTTVPPPPTTDPCEPPGYDDCQPPPTTVPPATTTEPPLSTIVTVPPTEPPATTDPCEDDDDRPGCAELARTGSDHLRPWAAAGLILLTAGAALVVVTRKRVTG